MGVLSRLFGGPHRALVDDLTAAYRAERTQADLLARHAQRARYPQAADALRRLSEIEAGHADRLRQRLHALGASIPAVDAPEVLGNSQWERAVAAHHAATAKRRRLIEQLTHWDPDEPEVAELLRAIADEDQNQFPVYEGIIMRSDPQALD